MKGESMRKCRICGKDIDPKNPYFTLSFNKEAIENGTKKIIETQEAAAVCEECGGEGLSSVLRHLKLFHDADTELGKKMEVIEKSVDFLALMKEFGISGEKIGTENQYLAKCPFHDQELSFLIDADRKEYFCFCEGLKGDAFSFIINYERDINHKHTTLKQAVDFLMEKFPIQQS
jgi:hypothetical protein